MTLLITTSTRHKILALRDVAQRCSEHQLYEGLATSCQHVFCLNSCNLAKGLLSHPNILP